MTVEELLQQARALSRDDQRQLISGLQDMLESQSTSELKTDGLKTGPEIITLLLNMDPIETVDSDIEDPVEWVAMQRRREAEKRGTVWGDED